MRRRDLIGALAAAAAAGWLPAAAAANAGTSGSARLREFSRTAQSASGRFTQVMTDKDGKRIDGPLEGDFAFERPGRFFWNVRTPYPQRIISDAKSIYVWDPDLNQVTIKRLSAAISSTPAAMLFGTADIDASFALEDTAAPANSARGWVWVRATPRTEDLTYAAIELAFDASGRIAAMRLKDHFGQTTALDFSGVEINAGVDPARFVFETPQGADVLRDDNGS